MKNLASHLPNPSKTPSSQPLPGREAQMQVGPAGKYVFTTGDWERLDRFLIIGTEGGTYYASERDLTLDNAKVVQRCLAEDHERVLKRIVDVSDGGLAPKNDPAILALALAFCEKGPNVPTEERQMALRVVCRTGTHLFQFVQAVRSLRGGGRSLNGAVRAWLDNKADGELAFQVSKYPSRAGWTWRDVMRRYRPSPGEAPTRQALYAWMAGKEYDPTLLPTIVQNKAQAATLEVAALPAFIRATRLPWECVPSEHTKLPDVLDALFDDMPLMATVRQLSKLQARCVLPGRRDAVIERLHNEEMIAKSRIHPVALLLAAGGYESGKSPNLMWMPDPKIVDALDDAFQLACKTAEPMGKRVLVAIDTSGSMRGQVVRGLPLHKVAAAMALTYVRSDSADVMVFNTVSQPMPLSGRMRVTDAARAVSLSGTGGTNCSLPFLHRTPYDVIVVFTDNESWVNRGHVCVDVESYRRHVVQNCRVVWCAMTAGSSSLGLPDDPLTLGIAGFDASAPQIISNFAAGKF